jgi:hypothetical protein
MKQHIKSFLKATPLYLPLRNWMATVRQKKELIAWEKNGRPVPPPHVIKQQKLLDVAGRYDLRILVETGTCYGDMVEAMKGNFRRIYSIELSRELYAFAQKRFQGEPSIDIIHGDSGVELGNLVRRLTEPALFWLDGHYSAGSTAKGAKDTPIYEELSHIYNSHRTGDVVLIDDARYFGMDPSYPSIAEINDLIKAMRPDVKIEIEGDTISVTPDMVTV